MTALSRPYPERIAELERELQAAEQVIAPFAREVADVGDWADDNATLDRCGITVGNLRAARNWVDARRRDGK